MLRLQGGSFLLGEGLGMVIGPLNHDEDFVSLNFFFLI